MRAARCMIARMKAASLILAFLVACVSPGAGDDEYPVTPPGIGGQGTGTGGGGGGSGSGGGTMLTAKICILTDSAKLDSCDAVVEPGIKVLLQSGMTRVLAGSTPANGSGLVITTPPAGGATYWVVIPPDAPANLGKPIIRSFVEYNGTLSKTAGGQLVPVFLEEDYLPLSGAHGAQFDETQGAVFARVVNASGVPVDGATTTIDPVAPVAAWYAGTNVDAWTQDAVAGTTTRGVVWYPGLAGATAVSISATKGALPYGPRIIGSLLPNYTTFVDVRPP
jgi:hypothetical protein